MKKNVVEEMDILVSWDTETDDMRTVILNTPEEATYRRMLLGAIYGLTREFHSVAGFKKLNDESNARFGFDDTCRIISNTLCSYEREAEE